MFVIDPESRGTDVLENQISKKKKNRAAGI